jgi:hypothetical protein
MRQMTFIISSSVAVSGFSTVCEIRETRDFFIMSFGGDVMTAS